LRAANVWRRAHANRVALLVDAAAYYDAVAEALHTAERSVFILGWDIDSRLELEMPDGREPLGRLLDRLVREREDLHVRILSWDYSPVYLFERQALPRVSFGYRTHRRVHFELDGDHPAFAAHHQKLVIVDDAIAFCGGLDLCDRRWDTPAHKVDDARRVDLSGKGYPPFHDVQMLVDGEAAAALAELTRERWRRATGVSLPAISGTATAWPPSVTPDVTDVEVGIARTEPQWRERPAIHEVAGLHLDAIAAAEHSIYLETQYFTSRAVSEALAERLRQPTGPEVVLVNPRGGDGWLESTTLGPLRVIALKRLHDANLHGRLRMVCPLVPGPGGRRTVFVHSKISIIDDRLLRVGSANLTNRSLGVDTECDLAIEAHDSRVADAIARMRGRLMGEHLGLSTEAVVESVRAHGLCATIDARRGQPRHLEPLGDQALVSDPPDPTVTAFADPERPVSSEQVRAGILPPGLRPSTRFAYVKLGVGLLALGALVLAWRFTPLGQVLRLTEILQQAESLRGHWAAPLAVIGAFALANLVFVPINLIVLGTIMLFGPLAGAAMALLGHVTGAIQNYGLGRALGADVVRRLGGPRMGRLKRRFDNRGILVTTLVRMVPIAPAGLVSLAAGAWNVRFSHYVLGTVFGTLPGLLAFALLGDRLIAALRTPKPSTVAALVAVVAGMTAVIMGLRAWLARRALQP
jgi:phospholipase D1/2